MLSNTSGLISILVSLAILSAGHPPLLLAQVSSGCGLALSAGTGVPLSELPKGRTGVPGSLPETVDLEPRPGGSVSFSCDGPAQIRIGTALDIYHLDRAVMAFLLGSGGVQLPLGTRAGSPWIRVMGDAGVLASSRVGNDLAIARHGRVAELDGLGFALGGGAALGLPLGSRWTFLFAASVRASFLDTQLLPEDDDGGFTSFLLTPLRVGFELHL